MDEMALLVDLHKRQQRQGPGGAAQTQQAMALAGLNGARPLQIADIGSGTGASTLQLARSLDAKITAVDFLPDFIDVLKGDAEKEGLSEKIETLVASMDALPFEDASYDVLWSEGAIYNMGFEKGLQAWRPFLKPGGLLAVSEITWLSATRPAELQDHWQSEYPEIATASAKLALLEKSGYVPLGYFVLPESCWLANYYGPLQDSFAPFLARHKDDKGAAAIVAAERAEITLYEKYKSYYSYGFYIARKQD